MAEENKKWRKRVLHWFRARYGENPAADYKGVEWSYRKFLKACADCKSDCEQSEDWRTWFNKVDRWARRKIGDSWFASVSWEDASDRYVEETDAEDDGEEDANHDDR